ncbi:hypothetical protein [Mycobacterium sp. M23085]|uniref:hypothetical protein n=1 Tax=Mycobacterium sp. M23085 TaxID=3378087 RepID=UPI0038782856
MILAELWVAEMSAAMSRFAGAAHLASWARVCAQKGTSYGAESGREATPAAEYRSFASARRGARLNSFGFGGDHTASYAHDLGRSA